MTLHTHEDKIKPEPDKERSERVRAWREVIASASGRLVLQEIIFGAEFCHYELPSVALNDYNGVLQAFNEGSRQVGIKIMDEIKSVDKQALCDIVKAHITDNKDIDDD